MHQAKKNLVIDSLVFIVQFSSKRTSLPSLYFTLLNKGTADEVSDTTGDAMKS